MHDLVEGREPELIGYLLALVGQLPEDVSEQHRPLRVASRRLEQRVERGTELPPVDLETLRHIPGYVDGRQRRQVDRAGLP